MGLGRRPVAQEDRPVGVTEQEWQQLARTNRTVPAIPGCHSPNPVTRSGRTVGPAITSGVGSAGVQHPVYRRGGVVTGDGDDGVVGQGVEGGQSGIEGLQHVPLGTGLLGVTGLVGDLGMNVHEPGATGDEASGGVEAAGHVSGEMVAWRHVGLRHSEQGGETPVQPGVRYRPARHAGVFGEAGQRVAGPPTIWW